MNLIKRIARKFKSLLLPKRKSVPSEFGGSGITEQLASWIFSNVPEGNKVIEFGAGYVSTRVLSERYELYSVEHDLNYVGYFPKANYIHSNLESTTGWYEVEPLKALPDSPYLTIIDGPVGEGKRFGILLNLELISDSSFIIIDDVWRGPEMVLAKVMAKMLQRDIEIHESFAVLLPPNK